MLSATDGQESRSISHGMTRKNTETTNTSFRAGCVSGGIGHPLGAKSKVANGGVAVGLPHRNSSVFKQTPINQWEVKEKGEGRELAD